MKVLTTNLELCLAIKLITTIKVFDYENDPSNLVQLDPLDINSPYIQDLLQISNLSGIRLLHNLQILELKNQNISNISELALLPSLTNVDLTGNPIPIADITWLRQQLPNTTILF